MCFMTKFLIPCYGVSMYATNKCTYVHVHTDAYICMYSGSSSNDDKTTTTTTRQRLIIATAKLQQKQQSSREAKETAVSVGLRTVKSHEPRLKYRISYRKHMNSDCSNKEQALSSTHTDLDTNTSEHSLSLFRAFSLGFSV